MQWWNTYEGLLRLSDDNKLHVVQAHLSKTLPNTLTGNRKKNGSWLTTGCNLSASCSSNVRYWKINDKISFRLDIYLRSTPVIDQPRKKKIKNKNPAGICLLKIHSRNIRTRCEVFSKLTIKTPPVTLVHIWHRSGVFIVNFEHISHLVLVFLLLNLNM